MCPQKLIPGTKHDIGNIFKEGELDLSTSVEIYDRNGGNASRPPMDYNLCH